jgi:hypothetical protein
MAGVAFAVEGDGVGFATESYAASALYTTLASLSGALWRIRWVSQSDHFRKVPILLKKSFWGDARKFLEPLMRFTRGDERNHIVSFKIDHGSPQCL